MKRQLIILSALLQALPALRAADAPSVTITGDLQEEIPLTKDKPETAMTFDKVAGLSREGQTDRVLSGPVEHMTGEDQMSLLRLDTRQAFIGLPIRIPAAPFVRMELSPGLAPASWELQVVDQEDRALKVASGTQLPRHLIEWDGFQDGAFKLKTSAAYTPVLLLTDDRRRVQRLFGEPVHFAVLQYIQDGQLKVEFDNGRLFERGRATFSPDMLPYLGAALDLLRQHVGKPFRFTLHASPANAQMAQKRIETLKAFFKDSLALEDDMLSFTVAPLNDRGDITVAAAAVR